METNTTITSDGLYRLADAFVEPEAVGSSDAHSFKPNELYIVKQTTRLATLAHSLALAEDLPANSKLLYLNVLASRPEVFRIVKTHPKEQRHGNLFFEHFSSKEVTSEIESLKQTISENNIRVIVLNSFEKSAATERHKKLLTNFLQFCAWELGCAVIIYTQDNRTKIAAGEFSRGALGALANLASEILDPIREQASKPPPPKPKPAVEWWPKEQLMTYQQRTGMRLAEKVKPRDLQMVLRAIKETRAGLLAGKIKLKRVSEEEEKAIIEKFLPANELEIKDLEARVYQDAEEAARREALGMNTEEYKMRWGS
ncbi:MAG TPA: hypothetical protein VEW28_07570 [Candidatus Kapabacteria bacterium]|nr:hypothetical protein [Candidatus Kapabacteria bacterium]